MNSSSAARSVAVVGAGIGGLALARALTVRGLQAEVYEASAEIKGAGGGLIVPPNSARILDRLGLGEVFRAGVPLRQMQILDAGGQVLYRRDQGEVRQAQGYGLHTVSRAALHQALQAALPPQILFPGFRLQELRRMGDKHYAVFANGQQVVADLIVAADGAQSRARALMFPEVHLEPTGQVAMRGVARADLPPAFQRSFTEIWGSGRRITFFPLANDEVYWHAAFSADHLGARPSLSEVAQHYAQFPQPVAHLLEATGPQTLQTTLLQDLEPLPQWSRGNVALLGDAAHATSPNLAQGAAQALEDAAALAELLSQEVRLETALLAYQKRRERYANAAVARSRQMGQIGQVGGPLRWIRNTTIKMNPELARSRIEAFYEEH